MPAVGEGGEESYAMTNKKKSRSIEVEGVTVKIDVDETGVKEATAALRELADAANAAREALDKLFPTIVYEAKNKRPVAKEWWENHTGVRPDGTRFELQCQS